MNPVHAAILYARAQGLAPSADVVAVPDGERCAASGVLLGGVGTPFDPPSSFGDHYHLADDGGRFVHPLVAAVMQDQIATMGGGSGVATEAGYSGFLTNRARLELLMDPPAPPFAIAVVNAKRQHVWWMARTAYDRDLIPVQFGHRRLVVDRPKAIAAARAILGYEAMAAERDGRPTYPVGFLSRDLKSPEDGLPTIRFQKDASAEADALRAVLADLSMGDLWAAMQIRAGVRETKTTTPEEAVTAYQNRED